MMKWIAILPFFLFLHEMAHGQLMDDFSDGDLSNNPAWEGDVDDYQVIDGQCRLNANGAGTSFIYTPVVFPDSLEVNFYFEINTNPSGGNFSRVYLALDQTDLSQASGLYLQLGEGGSNDAISLFELNNGSETLLASGTMGAIASRPDVNVQLIIEASGFLTLLAGYDSNPVLTVDLETMVNFDFSEGVYFGLYNTYTASNVQNYAYDDFSIQAFIPDTQAPELVEVNVISDNELEVTYNESLIQASIDPEQISIDPTIPIQTIVRMGIEGNTFRLILGEPLISGPEYTLTIAGVEDLNGNISSAQNASFFLAVAPGPGDIILNEILFNPVGSGSDYVELFVLSDKILRLDGMEVLNRDNERRTVIASEGIYRKGDFILLTEDVTNILDQYPSNDPQAFIENDLPDFNNANGNVSILINGIVIDSFDYDEDFHFNLIDDVDGVSLERLNPQGPSNSSDNWQSASSIVGFGTPGLENSNQVVTNPGDEAFTIEPKTFSPNLDGDQDNLVIQYAFEKSGFVANVKVFDNRGALVRDLYNNELLGTQGTLFWNGQDNDGKIGNVGIYIVYIDAFHPDGDRMTSKQSVVLADFLD
jgi:hypothetical protein